MILSGSGSASRKEPARGGLAAAAGRIRRLLLVASAAALALTLAGASPLTAGSLKDDVARSGHAEAPDHEHGHAGHRDSVWFQHGGPNIIHEFGYHPLDPARPRNRHYYPYVYGGYAFSAPFYVSRHEYLRRHYAPLDYGLAQKRRFYRGFKHPGDGDFGRW